MPDYKQLEKMRRQAAKAASSATSDLGLDVEKLKRYAAMFGNLDGNNEIAHVTLRYFCPHIQCFSEWSTEELSQFSAFIRKIGQFTWGQIYASGSGSLGEKTGFGYTPHKDSSRLPVKHESLGIGDDNTFFELRVTQKARVHGFRAASAFALVWLDREHKFYA